VTSNNYIQNTKTVRSMTLTLTHFCIFLYELHKIQIT
jgi:hypothetical protein